MTDHAPRTGAVPGRNSPGLPPRRLTVLALVAGAVVAVLLLGSCATEEGTVMAPPQIEGATFVGDKACLDCHNQITRAFPASPHGRLHLDNSRMAGQNGCESCHGPGSRHITLGGAGGSRDRFIVNPRKDPETCFQCHLELRAEFHFPQHHPVLEGKMGCAQCHDPHGRDIMKPAGGLAMATLNQSCAQCHREQSRPVVFEHAALREGCTSCHNPHGSINPKMLTVRDSNLCLRCHAQAPGPGPPGTIFVGNIDHTSYLRYGTCWTAGCHTAVHGSNTQPYYFY